MSDASKCRDSMVALGFCVAILGIVFGMVLYSGLHLSEEERLIKSAWEALEDQPTATRGLIGRPPKVWKAGDVQPDGFDLAVSLRKLKSRVRSRLRLNRSRRHLMDKPARIRKELLAHHFVSTEIYLPRQLGEEEEFLALWKGLWEDVDERGGLALYSNAPSRIVDEQPLVSNIILTGPEAEVEAKTQWLREAIAERPRIPTSVRLLVRDRAKELIGVAPPADAPYFVHEYESVRRRLSVMNKWESPATRMFWYRSGIYSSQLDFAARVVTEDFVVLDFRTGMASRDHPPLVGVWSFKRCGSDWVLEEEVTEVDSRHHSFRDPERK